jgi:hypothetical protein
MMAFGVSRRCGRVVLGRLSNIPAGVVAGHRAAGAGRSSSLLVDGDPGAGWRVGERSGRDGEGLLAHGAQRVIAAAGELAGHGQQGQLRVVTVFDLPVVVMVG